MSELDQPGDSMTAEASDIIESGTQPDPVEAPAEPLTAGGLLRMAREAAGLHIAALAVSLKVPVKKLEALEADRFDLLPDAVFARALASSVCRTLKIDAAPVLERLPQFGSPKLIYQGTRINTPFRAPSDGPGPSVWEQVSRPAVLAGLVLLLSALVLILLPAKEQGGQGQGSANSQGLSSDPVKTEDKVHISESSEFSESHLLSGPLPAPLAVPASPQSKPHPEAAVDLRSAPSSAPARPAVSPPGAGASVPATVARAPMVASSRALAAPATAASAAASGVVVFSAKSESWVEVIDAKGNVVLRRLLGAGEIAGASGVLPLAAVVGRADVTQVQIRGKAFNLSAVAKDNVARFEVK